MTEVYLIAASAGAVFLTWLLFAIRDHSEE